MSSAGEEARGAEAPDRESVGEALARARAHAAAAAAESVAALEALLDASARAAGDLPAIESARSLLGELLRGLRALLEPEGGRDGAAFADALLGALDAEIERWEARSREDPEDADARAVLRAFLGVRELIWELRRRENPGGGRTGGEGRGARGRVRHVPVEG